MKKNILTFIIGTCIVLTSNLQASNNKTIFGIAAATIAGIAILANSDNNQQAKQNHGYKKSTYKKRKKIVITDDMKVQIALKNLDFYKGKITGNLNSFKTKKAIKKMNLSYNISDVSNLKPEHKMSLIILSELFDLEKHLNVEKETKKLKNKRFQASLAVYGVYNGKIDGVCGKQTRIAVSKYKGDNNLDNTSKLTADEKFDLMSNAIDINEKKIFAQIDSMQVKNAEAIEPVDEKISNTKSIVPLEENIPKEKSWKTAYVDSNNTQSTAIVNVSNDSNLTTNLANNDGITSLDSSSDTEDNKVLKIAKNKDNVEKKKEITVKTSSNDLNTSQGQEVLKTFSETATVENKEEISWKEAYKI